jgi:hypothetical protein
VFPFSKRKRLAVAVGAAAVATGLTLAFGMSSAGAQSVAGQAKTTAPGDNGDVKIHNTSTSVTDERNEPHVCVFYLDAFNFDGVQSVSWWIEAWAPTGSKGSTVDSGMITLDSSGNGFTTDRMLPNGHYKLFWTFAGEKGAAKHKVFWVSCPATPPTSPPPSPSCETACESSSSPPTSPPPSPSCETSCESPSESPPPSPTTPTPPPAAPAPTPVQTTLPVTG